MQNLCKLTTTTTKINYVNKELKQSTNVCHKLLKPKL